MPGAEVHGGDLGAGQPAQRLVEVVAVQVVPGVPVPVHQQLFPAAAAAQQGAYDRGASSAG
ncbi:hypothetical protein [Streptomyces sp. TLI_185]|uniref:hypothetical protein n=1 Tax=Streptomyces sp. TLI_185 TaxID=2485151 RepID=UPI00288B4BA6|nr:hypothetical protein [Streptomyces sp. TLI_185]